MSRNSIIAKVAAKELTLFFSSPVAWLFLASFVGVCLFTFFWIEAFFARNIADVRPLFEAMPLLLIFLAAALTMRSWSEERASGTLEHVLTLPAPLWQFVLGKFFACSCILALALAATLPLPLTVASIASLDWGPVSAGYLAAFLMGCSYLAIGLFVSSRTDNAIVSLIGSVAICGFFYLLGSNLILGFFGGSTADTLRLLGASTRFDSITRGVLDLRDLYYYLAMSAIFLSFNVYALESGRWSKGGNALHRRWRLGTMLVVLNLLVAGLWLQSLTSARIDVTEGKLYSLSESSNALIEQIEEPMLIRGYFSERSHPLLAPLVPQLRDLLREYAVVSEAIDVEFIDPAEDVAAEQEANDEFGIVATPFQVADRYQSALVNAYFDVLIRYGDEYETLSFGDFIEVKTSASGEPDVVLRNPEFDITRAIRDVLYSYQSGGELLDQIESPVTLRAYISDNARLPELLQTYRASILKEANALASRSQGKFSIEVVAPESGDGSVANRIVEQWGFQPMITAIGDESEFYFYLTLEDDHQVIQLPTGTFDGEEFGASLEAGLRRFASGFTRTVSLVLPEPSAVPGGAPAGHSFATLQQSVSEDYTIRLEDLSDGNVDAAADLLVVMAPESLSDRERFALDQYLMRGGTIVLATAPYSLEAQGASLQLRSVDSGLEEWLANHGIRIENTVVLDDRNAPFPLPVIRQVGGFEFRDMQFVDYPYLLDVREDGLNSEHPITSALPQLTLGWASPIELTPTEGLEAIPLLSSSENAWRSDTVDVMPSVTAQGISNLANTGQARSPSLVGVLMQGEFQSSFESPPTSQPETMDPNSPTLQADPSVAHILKSPTSARLMLVSSNDFASDQVLSGVIAASGTQYFGPLELILNSIEWALEDASLTSIRSRAHFNRTLPPMSKEEQASIEYSSYLVALFILAALFTVWRLVRVRRDGQLLAVLDR